MATATDLYYDDAVLLLTPRVPESLSVFAMVLALADTYEARVDAGLLYTAARRRVAKKCDILETAERTFSNAEQLGRNDFLRMWELTEAARRDRIALHQARAARQ